MTDVYAYLRVSGRSQIRGDGFRRQFIAIRKFCASHDLHIIRIFKERGVCGASELEDRPALSNLFNALEGNGVKTIVIEKLDRLARDLMVQETIIADMQKSGYTLFSTCEPDLCSNDPSRVLMRQIFGAIAQYEKAMLVLKLRGARQRKKARGERGEGRHAYGEKSGEEATLQRILFLKHVSKYSTRAIADLLNSSGVPSRYGKPWHHGTIANVLRQHLPATIRQQDCA